MSRVYTVKASQTRTQSRSQREDEKRTPGSKPELEEPEGDARKKRFRARGQKDSCGLFHLDILFAT
eukprot:m.193913 g.193913  ORF g.193913 m.193913 type:complete len:66 (+) comp39483_c0_seq3:84-281(+)